MTRIRIGRLLGTLALGVVIGLIGTFMHRSVAPWGLVLALLTLLSGGFLARAWTAGAGVLTLGLGWLASVQVLSLSGPGGDVVVPAHLLGYFWVYGGLVFIVAAVLAPKSWFRDDQPADHNT